MLNKYIYIGVGAAIIAIIIILTLLILGFLCEGSLRVAPEASIRTISFACRLFGIET